MQEAIQDHSNSISDALGHILSSTEKLLRQEVSLVRAQIKEEMEIQKKANISAVTGATFVFIGLLLAAMTSVSLLNDATKLPTWSCYGISAVLFLVIGGAIFLSRRKHRQNKIDVTTQDAGEGVIQWKAK